MEVSMQHLLLSLVLCGIPQESFAWAPLSIQRGSSAIRMSPPTSTTLLAASLTSQSDINIGTDTGSSSFGAPPDYTKSFASGLEASRRELEQANAVVEATNDAAFSMDFQQQQHQRMTILEQPQTMPLSSKTKDIDDGNDHNLDQALALAAYGAIAVFRAIRFVAKETIQAAKTLNSTTTSDGTTTYGEAFAKISKSGQGILKLGVELARDSLVTTLASASASTRTPIVSSLPKNPPVVRGTRLVSETPFVSVTLPVVGNKNLFKATSVEPVVTYRPTISLSPVEAATVWGYTGEEKTSTVPRRGSSKATMMIGNHVYLKQLRVMTTHASQWTEQLLGSAAKDLISLLEDRSSIEVVDQQDFAYQQQVIKEKEEVVIKTGPAYFLNVHEDTSPPFVVASLAAAAEISPRPTPRREFFFAN